MSHNSLRDLCVSVVLLSLLCGCTQWDLSKKLPWSKDDSKPKVPTRMSDMWTYTVMRQSGQPGVRGFGGRILFYNNDDEKPIKVDGTLTVYAFAGAMGDASQELPEKKFVFPAEQFDSHYSESKLGHSYSVWLPWDEVGGPERQISLIARFENKAGEVLTGSPSHQTLPGFRNRPAGQGPVQQASYQQPTPPRDVNVVTTTTINVPPSFVRSSPASAPPSDAISSGATNARGIVDLPAVRPPAATRTPADPSSERAGAMQEPATAPQGSGVPTRFAPQRFPARRGSIVAPRSDLVRKQPYPATWPSALPATPRSAPAAAAPGTPPDAPPAQY